MPCAGVKAEKPNRISSADPLPLEFEGGMAESTSVAPWRVRGYFLAHYTDGATARGLCRPLAAPDRFRGFLRRRDRQFCRYDPGTRRNELLLQRRRKSSGTRLRQSLPESRSDSRSDRNLPKESDLLRCEGREQRRQAMPQHGEKIRQLVGIEVVSFQSCRRVRARSSQSRERLPLAAIKIAVGVCPAQSSRAVEMKHGIGPEVERQPAIIVKPGDDGLRFAGNVYLDSLAQRRRLEHQIFTIGFMTGHWRSPFREFPLETEFYRHPTARGIDGHCRHRRSASNWERPEV